MEKVTNILRSKPFIHLIIPIVYLFAIALLKWFIHPTLATALFAAGGVVGIYFLDVAEAVFHLSPSPFRSIIFFVGLSIVLLFIVTSSGSFVASGLVLSLFITLLLWMGKQLMQEGNCASWYTMIAMQIDIPTQRILFGALVSILLLGSFLFLR